MRSPSSTRRERAALVRWPVPSWHQPSLSWRKPDVAWRKRARAWQHFEPPRRNLEKGRRNLKVAPQNLELPGRNLELASWTLEVLRRNFELRTRNLAFYTQPTGLRTYAGALYIRCKRSLRSANSIITEHDKIAMRYIGRSAVPLAALRPLLDSVEVKNVRDR